MRLNQKAGNTPIRFGHSKSFGVKAKQGSPLITPRLLRFGLKSLNGKYSGAYCSMLLRHIFISVRLSRQFFFRSGAILLKSGLIAPDVLRDCKFLAGITRL